MKPDNSSYTVTAPDLLLTENGVNVLITSTDKVLTNGIKLLFEKYIMSSIVFNVQDTETTSASLPWMWHVSRTCEYMIVDLDTCAWEDIMSALLKTKDDNHMVIFYSEKSKRREAIKLINAVGKYIIFSNLDDLDKFLNIETSYPGMLDD
jgi:lipid II:glycine glycyltransferase (peptidoglycan interpeptide bridge formation enzyme)